MLYKGFLIKPVYLENAFDNKGRQVKSHFEVNHVQSGTHLGSFKKLSQAKKDVNDFYEYYKNLQ